MITDSNDTIIHMSKEEAETYDEAVNADPHAQPDSPTGEIDDELGLEVVPKQTIFQKYGVNCDPKKNSFQLSLYNQFERNSRLSEKQVNALRNSKY